MYEAERARIQGLLSGEILDIEHIGSTAVPGLAGKPIIDILAAIRNLDDARSYAKRLARIGYIYVPLEADDRHHYWKFAGTVRTHILHFVQQGSEAWKRPLIFRDHLKNNPDVARQYLELKRSLAEQFRSDRESYTAAKSSFVESIIETALADK